jgi:starch synthase
MRVLFAASEAAPFAKTGGLGDVAGGLPPALAGLGHDVRVVIPRYRTVDPGAYGLKLAAAFPVPVASWQERCDVLEGRMGKDVTVYFIDKDVYFDRPGLYSTRHGDYPDNAERFIFFSRAVLELCRALDFRPDIIHCNDWQTGLVPLYRRKLYARDRSLRGAASVFTIHNLGYQGLFWHWDLRLTGLGWDVFTPEGIEFWGKINFLKAGLVYSDVLTTVSPTYSREIQTPEYGHGLEGALTKRSADLYGILNGIDFALWDPARDKAIPQTFSAARLAGKAACKESLRERAGLPASDAPVISMVSRIVEQKGVDILAKALPEILDGGVQVVILGTGDEKYRKVLAKAESSHPGQMRFFFTFDEDLARLLYAGSDLFLMPSRYEPCGLGQMIALRYGTVPVVRKTGGLADTVADFDPKTGHGTGFVFEEYSAAALAACVRRAVGVYHDRKAWAKLVRSGMRQDFSWEHSAKEYEKVYRKAREKKQKSADRSQ